MAWRLFFSDRLRLRLGEDFHYSLPLAFAKVGGLPVSAWAAFSLAIGISFCLSLWVFMISEICESLVLVLFHFADVDC